MKKKSYKQRIKEETKEVIWNILFIIVIIIIALWSVGMTMDFINNPDMMLITYAQICLTLFGFCLIGGIFEREKVTETIRNLYLLAMIFLLSAISFFFVHSINTYIESLKNSFYYTPVSYLGSIFIAIAFFGFIIGIIILFLTLIQHWKDNIIKHKKN